MRLAFHYHIPVDRRDDGIWMPGYLARFVEGLAERVDHLYCLQHTALPHETERCDTGLHSTNVELVSLGPHASIQVRLMRRRRFARILKELTPSLDALLIRGPTPLLPLFGETALTAGVPVALLLVGNYVRSVGGLSQPRWKIALARALARWNEVGQERVARKSLVFVNSGELYHEYEERAARLVQTRTTTHRENELFWREDACVKQPIEVLSAGRFARDKGLFDILEAVRILVGRGLDVRWNLVGWEEQGGHVLEELTQRMAEYNMEGRFINHGFKRVGEELLEMYRRADIFVVASQLAEGFPRTIWEAMASSTPVVATHVGSIPHFLKDREHAVLVEPRRPEALADGMLRIIEDGNLRRRIVTGGYKLASENTVERRAAEMVQAIETWLQEVR